jgi:hypothetical protein
MAIIAWFIKMAALCMESIAPAMLAKKNYH